MYKRYIKKFMDFILSLSAIVVLSPVLLVVALLVRIKLGSPVIFVQKRPGFHEKIFSLCKFRTMLDKRDIKGDLLPDGIRLTRFGKLLRSTSLDELPELFNILKGDMSIVGPRPLLIKYLPLYNNLQKRRHDVRPGLSGLAQISGRNSISWEDKFKLDLQYIENVSFINDWKIIIMSIKKALCREGINSDTAVTMDEFRGSQEGKEHITKSSQGIKMKKKVLFVATVMYHFQAFHLPYMKMLQENGYEVHIAANGKIELPYCDKCYVIPIERSPYKISNLKAYKTLKKIIQTEQFDIVHCHTPMGGIIARLSANKLRKNGTKVIYTAHGFHFFKGAPLINWLIYYPVERLFAKFTDILITINQEDYARAQKFKAGKVVYIPGVGIDTNKYAPVETDKAEKRRELGIPENSFVMLSVGELSKRKNQEVIIKAIAKLNNTDIQYLICGEGSLVEYLKRLAATLGIEKQVQLLGFRRDIAEICQACDSFVFPSLQEGLPVALMEAMAGGMPVVCSDIRGNTDLIQNGKGGIMVKPNDVEGFANAIGKLIQNKELQRAMRAANLKTIKSFDLSAIIKDMEALYMEV